MLGEIVGGSTAFVENVIFHHPLQNIAANPFFNGIAHIEQSLLYGLRMLDYANMVAPWNTSKRQRKF